MGSTEIVNSNETFMSNIQNKQGKHDVTLHKHAILQIEDKIIVGAYQPVERDNSLEQLAISTEIELVNEREGNVLGYPNVNISLNDIEKWLKRKFFQGQKLQAKKTDSDTDSTASATNSNQSSPPSCQTATVTIDNKDQSLLEESLSSHSSQTIPEASNDAICEEKHIECNVQLLCSDSPQNESKSSTVVLEDVSDTYQDATKPNKESENASATTDCTGFTGLQVRSEESSESSEDLSIESSLDRLPVLSSKQLVYEWLNSSSEKSPKNVFRSCKACAFLSAKKYAQPKFNKSLKRDFASMSKSERRGELERIYGKKFPETSFSNKSMKRRPKWKF